MKSSTILLVAVLFFGEVWNGYAAASGGAAAGGAAGGGAFGAASGSGTASGSGNAAVSGNASGATAPSGNGANTTPPAQPGALVPLAQTNPAVVTTNPPPSDTNQPGTNQVNVTNQFNTTNQVNVTNQSFSTNFVSVTNRVGLGPSDIAASEFDRALIVQVRQRIFIKDPGISASWAAASFAGNGGTILVSGTMLNATDKDQLLVLVRNTPGVVGVVDHVLVTPNGNTANANTSSQKFLSPNPDPSLSESARFGAPNTRPTVPSQATIIPTNFLTPTGFTNVATTNGTNVILEGTVGTNVIVVPVETNTTSP